MATIPMTPAQLDEPKTSLWRDAWYRLVRNKLAIFGLIVIVLLALTAAFGP